MSSPDDISPEMEAIIEEAVADGVQRGIEIGLKHALEAVGVKPLLNEKDVLRTLKVGRTTFIQRIQPVLPPIFIGGQKRWDPDAVSSYIRAQARKSG